MTVIEITQIRLKCMDIALTRTTRHEIEKNLVFELAEKIYEFATGKTEKSVPK